MSDMKRREFIALLGGVAAVWPLAARAQKSMPVIGFLTALSEAETSNQIIPFRRGLSEGGLVEGQNVAIEYRFADGQYERLTALAAEFVRRPRTERARAETWEPRRSRVRRPTATHYFLSLPRTRSATCWRERSSSDVQC